jgi:hypothetical protein
MKLSKMVWLKWTVGMLLLACPVMASAQKSENPAPKPEEAWKAEKKPPKGTVKQPEESKGALETYKRDFLKETEALDKKIAQLSKKIKQQGTKLEGEARESWDDLKAKQKVLKSRMKDLSAATRETWEKSKNEAEAAKEELKKALEKVASYFKQ